MLNFLKVFARGIICTVLLPIILAVWVLYGVYCLVVFVVMLVKSVILFFAGDSAAGEMKEDREAREILEKAEKDKAEQAQVMNMMYQSMAAQQQMMQQQMMQQQQESIPAPQPQLAPQPAIFDPTVSNPAREQEFLETNTVVTTENKGGSDDGESN